MPLHIDDKIHPRDSKFEGTTLLTRQSVHDLTSETVELSEGLKHVIPGCGFRR